MEFDWDEAKAARTFRSMAPDVAIAFTAAESVSAGLDEACRINPQDTAKGNFSTST
jgi:hypothetical protein